MEDQGHGPRADPRRCATRGLAGAAREAEPATGWAKAPGVLRSVHETQQWGRRNRRPYRWRSPFPPAAGLMPEGAPVNGSGARLRVEMVLPALVRAGMETVTAALGQALIERGHDVGFTCTEALGELGVDMVDQGLRVCHVPAPGLRTNFFPRDLSAWFRERQPDVVHAHSGVWLKAAQAARQAGVPRTVFTAHGLNGVESWLERLHGRLAARRTDEIIAVSEPLRRHMADALGLAEGRVRVIPNGVSVERFAGGAPQPGLRESLGIPPDATVVGNVARFHPVKNHALLVDAFARLRRQRPDAFLLLVGDGPSRPAVEARIASLGLESRVRITGLVRDPAPLFPVMDLFVLSSHTEGTSISLLEAMASGVPVIATAVGGNPALLADGRCGSLTPPGDTDSLAGAMLRVLTDRGLRERLVREARRRVADHYSVATMAQAYEGAYRG